MDQLVARYVLKGRRCFRLDEIILCLGESQPNTVPSKVINGFSQNWVTLLSQKRISQPYLLGVALSRFRCCETLRVG
jgi:hypothetical protein